MNLSEYAIVSKVFLFSGMNEQEASEYIEKCEQNKYASGDIIHSESNRTDGIGVIISGKARIVSGNGDALLRILNKGDIFGAASMFAMDDRNRTAVIALGKCSILMIPHSVVIDIIETVPGIAVKYISFLSDRINFLNARISSITAGDAVTKTAGFLLTLNVDHNGKCEIEDSLTNIASRLNMGRSSLYRTIDRFVADGLISREKDSFVILDRDGLEDIAFKK